MQGARTYSTVGSNHTPMDDMPESPYEPPHHPPTFIVHKKGMDLLHDPLYNKVRCTA